MCLGCTGLSTNYAQQLTRSRWSGAPRPVTRYGSLPGRPLQAAGSPLSQGSGPGSEDCREPLAPIVNCRSGICGVLFGLVIDPRFGDVPLPCVFKSPLGHQVRGLIQFYERIPAYRLRAPIAY